MALALRDPLGLRIKRGAGANAHIRTASSITRTGDAPLSGLCDPKSSRESNALWVRLASAKIPGRYRDDVRTLARDLPETEPQAASRRPAPRFAAAPSICAVVWSREVLQGRVNP